MLIIKIMYRHPDSTKKNTDALWEEKLYSGVKRLHITHGEKWQGDIPQFRYSRIELIHDQYQADATKDEKGNWPAVKLTMFMEGEEEDICVIFNTVAYVCGPNGNTIEKILGS